MFVFSNLAVSVDGKIATRDRNYFPLGTKKDLKLLVELRDRADVVLMGAGTLRTWKRPCLGPGPRQPANAVVSATLEGISPSWPFFKDDKVRRILFVGAGVSRRKLAPFKGLCEIHSLREGKGAPSPARQILRALERDRLRRVVVEGGGGLMWEFVRENLIDEYYVTLTPRLLGGTEAPTLVDGEGFERDRVLNLKLHRVRRAGNELFLVYRKTPRRGP